MALFDVVSFNEILLKERLDAFSFVSQNSILARLVNKRKHQTIGELSLIHKVRNRDSRVYVKNKSKGLMYLSNSDISKTNITDVQFMSKKFLSNIEDQKIVVGDILTSAVGAIGTVCYVNKQLEGSVISGNLLRFTPRTNAGYIFAFLQSKYGQAVLKDLASGSVQEFITPPKLGKLAIPSFSPETQKRIHNLITNVVDLRVKANDLLKESEIMFEKENELVYDSIFLESSENISGIGFQVKFSSKLLQTFKARNYSERATSLINIWDAAPGKLFNDWVSGEGLTRGMGGFFKRIDNNKIKGADIISQGDIHDIRPKFKQVIIRDTKESEIARKNMIIIPSAGTLGENEIFLKPELVYLNFEGKILSEVVGKLRCSTLDEAAYLFTALKSKAGFRILRAMVYGTNLMYPRWDLLKNINIPCKDEIIFKNISNLVKLAYEKRAEANQNENQAIQLVEKEIEQWQQ